MTSKIPHTMLLLLGSLCVSSIQARHRDDIIDAEDPMMKSKIPFTWKIIDNDRGDDDPENEFTLFISTNGDPTALRSFADDVNIIDDQDDPIKASSRVGSLDQEALGPINSFSERASQDGLNKLSFSIPLHKYLPLSKIQWCCRRWWFRIRMNGIFYKWRVPHRCNHCFSQQPVTPGPQTTFSPKYLIARHGETRTDCGGRTCQCYDGRLTCDANQCHHRREYSMLGTDAKGYDEKQLLVDAFHYINRPDAPSNPGDPTRKPVGHYFGTTNPWTYHQTVLDHSIYSGIAHGGPEFLPWHRQYLWELEQKLQAFHKCVTLPYWDWTMDADADTAHITDNYFGGDGDAPSDPESDACSFKPGSTAADGGWSLPGPTTFTRSGDNTGSLPSAGNVANILSQTSFASFASMNEGTHGSPHVRVGGLMGSLAWSPSDPFFWMHHAMVDKIWWDWQHADWANRWNAFTGSPSAQVSPQWSGRTNADTFDSEGSLKVCYDDVVKNLWVMVEWLRVNDPSEFNSLLTSETDLDWTANSTEVNRLLETDKLDQDAFPFKLDRVTRVFTQATEVSDTFKTTLAALEAARSDPQLAAKLNVVTEDVGTLNEKFRDVKVQKCGVRAEPYFSGGIDMFGGVRPGHAIESNMPSEA